METPGCSPDVGEVEARRSCEFEASLDYISYGTAWATEWEKEQTQKQTPSNLTLQVRDGSITCDVSVFSSPQGCAAQIPHSDSLVSRKEHFLRKGIKPSPREAGRLPAVCADRSNHSWVLEGPAVTIGGGNLSREKTWVFLLIKGSWYQDMTEWSQGLRLACLFC